MSSFPSARPRPLAVALFACSVPFAVPAGPAADDDVDEVVITATPLRSSPLETAQPAVVLSGDALDRAIAKSLGETLADLPGVTGTYFGPIASRPVIRGLSGPRVRVLEDSVGSLDVSALSEDHAVTIDPLVARTIEVIKGPATLMYGSAAVGGVVNVLTNRIPETRTEHPFEGLLSARGDTVSDQLSGALSLDATAGGFAFHADGFSRDSDDISIPGDSVSSELLEEIAEAGEEEPTNSRGVLYGSDGKTEGWALGGSWLIGERGYLGVAATGYTADYGTPGPETQPDGASVRIDMDQERYDLSGGIEDPFAGVTAIRVRMTDNDYTHTEFEPSGEPGTLFEQDAFESRLAVDHAAIAGWRGSFGLQYLDLDFDAIGEEAFVPASQTESLGVFLFEEQPFGSVTVQLGVRYEDQQIDVRDDGTLPDYDDTSWSGSAGAVWNATEALAAAFNYTHAQRHPSATELYADGPHVALSRYEIGDPDLAKESTNTFDLSLRKHAGSVQFAVSLYYSQYGDYIYPQPTGEFAGEEEPFPVVVYRQQDAEFYGVEAEVSFPLLADERGDLTLRLLTDYVRAELDDGSNVPLMPPWRFGAELDYARGNWQAGLGLEAYADHDDVAENELPTAGYTFFSADVGYRMPIGNGSLLVFLEGSNLFDEEARRSTSPVKDYAPLPGVSLLAGARLDF